MGQIAKAVQDTYGDLIDFTDVASAPEDQQVAAQKTRGLAAFALQSVVGDIDPATAARHVTDGSGDNGIDALFVDPRDHRIYVIQSKWHESGTGSIGVGEIRNTIAGVKDLTELRFDRFNSKFSQIFPDVEDALGDPSVTFSLVIACTGDSDLPAQVQGVVDDAVREMNEISEMLSVRVLGLVGLHKILREGGAAAKIDLDVVLESWGTLDSPYVAYYGLVEGVTIANWYADHGGRLFDDNLRKALGPTSVNVGLLETLATQPEHFWYFNNGITVLCDSVRKTGKGGSTHSRGEFSVQGLSVVNGAQTVSSLAERFRAEPESLESVRVWVRLISLEGCPEGFASDVTRATNTQNVVESRDFLALDPLQQQLQDDLQLSLGKRYVFKRGEPTPEASVGCTVADALVALACSDPDSGLAVVAKSAVGRLEDRRGRYYQRLFNSTTTAIEVWQTVEVYRWIERELAGLRKVAQGKRRAAATQGNRMIAHAVFQRVKASHDLRTEFSDDEWAVVSAEVPGLVGAALDALGVLVEGKYANNYVTSLFKNAAKCSDIAVHVNGVLGGAA